MATLVARLAAGLAERGVDVRVSAPVGPARATSTAAGRCASGGAASRRRRRRAGPPAPAAGGPAVAPRRRGGRLLQTHRLRLGRPRDVRAAIGRGPLAPARHRVPGPAPQPAPGGGHRWRSRPARTSTASGRTSPATGRSSCAPRSAASTTRARTTGATTRWSSGPGPSWASSSGVTGQPAEASVARWPRAFPQYRVHHLLRMAGIEAAVARLGGVAVAGAAYHGVGIPACIASGRAAADALL